MISEQRDRMMEDVAAFEAMRPKLSRSGGA
jgi:hypothetical protein